MSNAKASGNRNDILIVGAGPTGLVLALWLNKLGITVRIIDKTAEPGTTSRALAVQARTLELYQQLDLAKPVVDRGHRVPGVNLWVKGEPVARLPFETIGAHLTPYSFLEIFPQDQHEQLLIERLTAVGVVVERQTELIRFEDKGKHVVAWLRGRSGVEEVCETSYIAGCDGARSVVERRSAQVFRAEHINKSSMLPMSKPMVPPSMANCTLTSTKPISWRSSLWQAKVVPGSSGPCETSALTI